MYQKQNPSLSIRRFRMLLQIQLLLFLDAPVILVLSSKVLHFFSVLFSFFQSLTLKSVGFCMWVDR